MAAGSKRPNLQTGTARRHSLHRKVRRGWLHLTTPCLVIDARPRHPALSQGRLVKSELHNVAVPRPP